MHHTGFHQPPYKNCNSREPWKQHLGNPNSKARGDATCWPLLVKDGQTVNSGQYCKNDQTRGHN